MADYYFNSVLLVLCTCVYVCMCILTLICVYMHMFKINFCSFTCVARGPFDCETMASFLSNNSTKLSDLPFNEIKLDLVACEVISHKESMDHQSTRSLTREVFNIIRHSLVNKQPIKFKSLLKVMEGSLNAILEDAAKRLG